LGFIYPLDREVVVTGNYGEIRPNHFHAGLDFSTDPSINLPIKSVADGYVSRIKIGSGGYGRVLYITHTNGYVSVYAHQKKYAQKIDEYIKRNLQLEQKKNEIEVYPKA
jgi:murein DD-endopeptidase MepM/ murein hydrolase activator NlpD